MNDIEKDTVKYLATKRIVLHNSLDKTAREKLIYGFILYFLIFIILIPIILVKYKYFEILAVYFPNLDLIATVLGYHGGPYNTNIWRHLYNPANVSLEGYISSNTINFFALLGVTYIIAYYTFINKNIYVGWSRAFIMLPLTYFIPSNFIILYMNKFGVYLNKFFENKELLHYILNILFGFCLIVLIIIFEVMMIKKITPNIIKLLKLLY